MFVSPLKSEGFGEFVQHTHSLQKLKLELKKCPELCLVYFLANIGLMTHYVPDVPNI